MTRQVRDDIINKLFRERQQTREVKKLQKDKLISEDEGKKAEADVQKVTDDFIKKVDQIADEKEKAILTI